MEKGAKMVETKCLTLSSDLPSNKSSLDVKMEVSNKDYEPLNSRMSILTDILAALSNPDVNMIGILGPGGVGKTTLAKEVALQLERNKLFDQVVFAEVSWRPNIRKIREAIADKIVLKLSDEENESEGASTLHKPSKTEPKILVILDDIWTSIDLKAVGIPFGDDHKGCKVLLTSRREDVLEKMGSQKNFSVDVLNNEERWSLFKKMAGEYIEDSELKPVATEVIDKCTGLPLAIVTVAKALKHKSLLEWKGALQELTSVSSENFENIPSIVYSIIELSYNYLESGVFKRTVLLIGYAHLTSIDDLLVYGTGLGLFEGINTIEERQGRARKLVQHLKDSCLLVDNITSNELFSMHDIVRDVAISIASRKHQVFTNKGFDELEWPDENTLKVYPSIILEDVKRGDLPEVLECRGLKVLSISAADTDSKCKIHDRFFKRMRKLRVLVLANVHLPSLSSSLRLLTNLQALGLYNCKVDNIATLKGMKKLETVSLQDSYIMKVPLEMDNHNLTRVEWIDWRDFIYNLRIVNRRIVTSLPDSKSYIGYFLIQSEEEEPKKDAENEELNNDGENVSSDKSKDLSKLTYSEIQITSAKTVARDLLFEEMGWHKLVMGRVTNWDWDRDWVISPRDFRKFKLLLIIDGHITDRHIMQLKKIEDISLVESRSMNSVLVLDREDFSQTKYLQIQDNENLLCIADMELETGNAFPFLESLLLKNLVPLEKICSGQVAAESFTQLRKIKVESCHKLENIFSFSIAKGLQQLQSINVIECANMKEIFAVEREDESAIKLNRLRSLSLNYLPQLTSFYSERQDILATLFNEKVASPNLENLELYQLHVERIWKNKAAAISSGIQNLTRLIIESCSKLSCLFLSSTVSSLVRLKHLKVRNCPVLKEMISISDDGLREKEMKKVAITEIIELNQLHSLTLSCLLQLKSFCSIWDGTILEDDTLFNEKVVLPNLKILELHQINVKRIWQHKFAAITSSIQNLTRLIVSHCSNLRCLFSSSMISSLVRLQHLEISNCRNLEEIIVVDDNGLKEKEMKKVALPISNMDNHLKMKVEHCDKIRTLFPWNTVMKFLRLEYLSVSYCHSLEVIFDMEGPNFEETNDAVSELSELDIVGLPKLRHVWNKEPQNFPSFQKLKTVSIVKCDKLKSVFPVSVACTLSHLEMLDASSKGMEEIAFVFKEGAEVDHRFVFRSVISLTLRDLPELKTFFPGIHTWEWLALEKLHVSGWNKGEIFTSESNKQGQIEKALPNLKELIAGRKDTAMMTKQFPEDLLSKLKNLYLEFDESTAISSLDFLQRLHNIKIFRIVGIPSFCRRYGDCEIENGMSAVITNLNICSDLKHILKEEADMDNLVQLQVVDCDNLIQLVASPTSFQNLTTLEIYGCRKLINIVTGSTAKSLVRLRKMTVDSCDMITEIVANEGKDHEIVFNELKELKLIYLESLTCFCSGNYTLKFPSLEKLTVVKCPKMKIFYGGTLSTPNLKKVKHVVRGIPDYDGSWCSPWTWHWSSSWKDDLNTTIQQVLEEDPKMKNFSGGELSTPKLNIANQRLEDKVCTCKGNYNAVIKQLHEGMSQLWGLETEVNDEEENVAPQLLWG